LDFYRSRLSKITAWGDRWPSAGWEFSQLTIPTAELLSTFPAEVDPYTPAPPPIIALPTRGAASTPTVLPPRTILFLADAVDRVANRAGVFLSDAAATVHNALCAKELIARDCNERAIPLWVWRELTPAAFAEQLAASGDAALKWGFHDGDYGGECYWNPSLRTVDVDFWLAKAALEAEALDRFLSTDAEPETHQTDQSSAERAPLAGSSPAACANRSGDGLQSMELPLPIYLQFLIELVPQLGGRDRIAAAKKEDTEGEIRARWRPELPSPSQNLLGAMATILRPPEAQRGGAKPMRVAVDGASGEGWNGSTPAALEG
jgi:hypothetical protein